MRNRLQSVQRALTGMLQATGLGMCILMLTACTTAVPIPPWPDLPRIPTPFPASPTPEPLPVEKSATAAVPTYILLMGTDRTSAYAGWRTDLLLLLMISADQAEVTLISLPRDWYVEVPGYGFMRVNQVDFIGELQAPGQGPRLLNTVFQQYMGLELDHWIRFHMDGFHDVFRVFEPIEVLLACPFYEPIWDARTEAMEWYHIPAGTVRMDAHTAFLYVRLRGFSSDFGRLARQRHLLEALRNQIDSRMLLALVPELLTVMHQHVQTDMSVAELLDWLQLGLSIEPQQVKGVSVDHRFVMDMQTSAGAAVLRLRSENLLHVLTDNPEQYVRPLDEVVPSTCRLPYLTGEEFQRITQLNNVVSSVFYPGTPVSLIAPPNQLIALHRHPGLSSNVISRYAAGTRLTIVYHPDYPNYPVPATDHRWYYVETLDQVRGWVSDRYLRLARP